jgi:hypothetical protein
MGICSVLKLVTQDGELLHEEDFDKVVEGSFLEIALSLDKHHPFRRLMNVLTTETSDEKLFEKFESAARGDGEDDLEMGWLLIPPELLDEFRPYFQGNIEEQWNDLFPGKKPGLRNFLRYHLRLKEIEKNYKECPQSGCWVRDDFSTLCELLQRAVDDRSYIIRTFY